jgi:dihydrofolate synthase/folylpolyglutamate synthase
MLTYSPVIDRDSALAYLQGRINYERTPHIPYRESEFKLDRMRHLLQRLGNPHLAFPALHIAGTKGKGSTATMAAAVLAAAGFRTGLYTSPHLERLEERLVINGEQCREREFVRWTAEIADVVAELDADTRCESRGATFFEITTALAFLHFARSNVDLAVLEVGLGGRLDSTNVCQPLACAITSISFDHTKQLGNTLEEIAAEKAGIAKRDVPLVCGVAETGPREVIQRVVKAAGARRVQLGVDYGYETIARGRLNYWDTFSGDRWGLHEVEIAMPGRHQAANAACAIALLRQLHGTTWQVAETAMRTGLRNAFCSARVEVLRREPLVILDAAHNVASVAALLHSLEELDSRSRRLLIFGTTRDKDVAGMLRLLLPGFQHILFTRYVNNPRAVEPTELAALARAALPDKNGPVLEAYETPADAWQRAHSLQGEFGLTCVTGSFFLAAELRPLIDASYLP